ncbi:MAG: ABC transporter ATP-binding protein [Limnochordia bacterium]|jgi:ABC-type multidrug transport system fused ATPase/permease subunit
MKEQPKGMNFQGRILRRLLAYLSPYRSSLAGGMALMVLVSLLELAGPKIIQLAIDEHIVGRRPGLTNLAIIYIILHGCLWMGNYYQVRLTATAAQRALYDLRRAVFTKLQRLPLSFYDGEKTGRIITRATGDMEALHQFLNNGVLSLVNDLLILFGVIFIMLATSRRLSLYVFLTLPLLVFIASYLRRGVFTAYREVRRRAGELNGRLQEDLNGMRIIQAFDRGKLNEEEFEGYNYAHFQAHRRAVVYHALFFPAVELTGTLAVVLILGIGGSMVARGELTIGALYLFLSYLTRFFQPIRNLSNLVAQSQQAMAGAERIFQILDTPADDPGPPGHRPITGRVRFQGVTFGYDPQRPVLKDISFTVQPGQRVAIVGPTGAGKTSLINLLARFYRPQEGTIYIDEHDLNDYSLASLRSQMSLVLQEPFIFDGTIGENIAYGRPGADQAAVEGAAQVVLAHQFITRLPQGYQTRVFERGVRLSLGQRQLIAFARAVLVDPQILILDEATSSVDIHTEALIQGALENLLANRTSFIVAHRLSTIRNADLILVLDEGRIVEMGSHRELVARGGLYKELYGLQGGRK